jgi:serine/threonine-protein kinase
VYYLGRDPATQVNFVVMEHLPGGSLRQRLAFGRLPLSEALPTFTTICRAVDFAHRHGVIHRDLKPDNVMYDADGKLIVTDFDLARVKGEDRLTQAGSTMGTIYYMPPEQVSGDEVDHTSDIYSLGVMLFEMLTGRWPFTGEKPVEILEGHMHKPPPRPSAFNPQVPAHMDEAVLRALEKAPRDRFQSALELAAAANGQPYTPPHRPAPPDEVKSNDPLPLRETVSLTPPSPPPQAALRVVKGAQAGQTFAIGAGVSIGFGQKNDIRLSDDFASRAHARVDQRGQAYQIQDLKSRNGTTVNGQKIEPYTPVALKPGDEIEVGDTVLVFE